MTCPLLTIWPSLLQPWFFIILFQPYQLFCCSPPKCIKDTAASGPLYSMLPLPWKLFPRYQPDGFLYFFFKYCSNVMCQREMSWLLYIWNSTFSLTLFLCLYNSSHYTHQIFSLFSSMVLCTNWSLSVEFQKQSFCYFLIPRACDSAWHIINIEWMKEWMW